MGYYTSVEELEKLYGDEPHWPMYKQHLSGLPPVEHVSPENTLQSIRAVGENKLRYAAADKAFAQWQDERDIALGRKTKARRESEYYGRDRLEVGTL